MENNVEIFENLDQVGLEDHDIEEIENPSDDYFSCQFCKSRCCSNHLRKLCQNCLVDVQQNSVIPVELNYRTKKRQKCHHCVLSEPESHQKCTQTSCDNCLIHYCDDHLYAVCHECYSNSADFES